MPRNWYRGPKVKHWPAPRELWGDMTQEGGCRKVVWHTSESDPGSIEGVAHWVQAEQIQYTLIWDPLADGEVIQLLPASVGARATKNDGVFPTNRYGEVCIAVCVVGRAADHPLKGHRLKGRRELLQWFDTWDVPRKPITEQWPPPRSRRVWKRSGHGLHLGCPGNDHRDPGRVDWERLLAR